MKRLVSLSTLCMLLAVSPLSAGAVQVPFAPDQPAFVLPPPQGPNPVGVRSFSWIDDRKRGGRTASGAVNREVSVQIWYPAAGNSEHRMALYSPGLDVILAAAADVAESDRGFITAHEPLLDTATNSLPDAEILHRDDAWPVILFSPGGNVSRHWQTVLAEGMASRGFVFVAMSHPFSTIDVAPESGFSMSIDWNLDQEDDQAAAEADNRLADVLAGDAALVLEQLRDLARDGASFAGALDLDDVGIAGHSRGGKTVGRVCASDPAFRACAVIENVGPSRERTTGIQPPFMTLRSPWGEERVAELHDYLSRTGSVAYDVEMTSSNHFTCTDLPLFIPGLRADGVDPADGIENCARILAGFFDAYLVQEDAGDETWVPAVDPALVNLRRF